MNAYILYLIEGYDCLYDLSNRSLDTERVGLYDGEIPIFSAERLLVDLEKIRSYYVINKISVLESKIQWEES